MRRAVAATAAALLAAMPAAAAQPQTQPQPQAPSEPVPEASAPWLASERSLLLVPARIAVPRQAGSLTAVRNGEFTRQGENLDNVIQYRSADGAVIGTVYNLPARPRP